MPEFNDWFPTTYLPSEGFKLTGTNVDCTGDLNSHSAAVISVNQHASQLNPGFVNSSALTIQMTSDANGGHNYYRPGLYTPEPEGAFIPGSNTANKHTFQALGVDGVHRGAGQRNLSYFGNTGFGMGDSCVIGFRNKYWGGPVAGDEGQGFTLVNHLEQGDYLQIGIVGGMTPVVVRSALDTTTTQVITASKDLQTVTVASSAGAAVGDWVVVEQLMDNGYPITEPVQITAVNSGGANRITGIFVNHHPNGVKVRPATCVAIDGAQAFGQQRVIVNMGQAGHDVKYTTGQILEPSGGALTGTGTTWSTTMVGGDADNIGAIAITNDTYTGPPFNAIDQLRSWHQVTAIFSPTSLGFHTFSCGGDAAYKGRGVFPSAYTIRPAMRMLNYAEGRAICEYSTHVWQEGDVVECAMCPYPDITAFQFHMAQYTPCGQNARCFFDVINTGARTFTAGIQLRQAMYTTGGADTVGWLTGIFLEGCKTGINIVQNATDMTCAIQLQCAWADGCLNDNGSKIDFRAGHIMANSANQGLEIVGTLGVKLSFLSTAIAGESKSRMDWDGSMRLHGWLDIEERGLTAAPAVATDMARIFAQDNGAGKTQLMVQFDSGAAVQLAIEP